MRRSAVFRPRAPAVNPPDPPAFGRPTPPRATPPAAAPPWPRCSASPPSAARRRRRWAAVVAATASAASSRTARAPTRTKDAHAGQPPPRDLVSAFARRLREGVPELALAPPQQPSFRDFVAQPRRGRPAQRAPPAAHPVAQRRHRQRGRAAQDLHRRRGRRRRGPARGAVRAEGRLRQARRPARRAPARRPRQPVRRDAQRAAGRARALISPASGCCRSASRMPLRACSIASRISSGMRVASVMSSSPSIAFE